MSGTTILAIAVPVLVVLGAILVFTAARKRDLGDAIGSLSRETVAADRGQAVSQDAEPATGREVEAAAKQARSAALVKVDAPPPAPYVPPDPEELGVTRRQFLNRSIVATMGLGLSAFGAGVLAFLWPSLGAGFGSKIRAGTVDDILAQIRDTREPVYKPEGRFYINPYPTDAVSAAQDAGYSASVLTGMEAGVVALYQKCPHLGCRVPWCKTSQWFECPCHGSQYNRVGEKKGGPAPRGMDRFPTSVEGTVVVVDTGTVIQGPKIGTNTTGQESEGPHCIDLGGGGH